MLSRLWCLRFGAVTRTLCRGEKVPNGDAAVDVASPRMGRHASAGGCAGVDGRMNLYASRVGVAWGVEISPNKAGRSKYTHLLIDFFSDVGLNIFDRVNMVTLAVEMFL